MVVSAVGAERRTQCSAECVLQVVLNVAASRIDREQVCKWNAFLNVVLNVAPSRSGVRRMFSRMCSLVCSH